MVLHHCIVLKRKTRTCLRSRKLQIFFVCGLLIVFICSYLKIEIFLKIRSGVPSDLINAMGNGPLHPTHVDISNVSSSEAIRIKEQDLNGKVNTNSITTKRIPSIHNTRKTYENISIQVKRTITKFSNVVARHSLLQAEPVNCSFVMHPYFPLCMDKVNFLKQFWNTHKCWHQIHKVDGSQCSIYNYFTKIEPFCMGEMKLYQHESAVAITNFDVKGLLKLFENDVYKWMRGRILFLWSSWVNGGKLFSTIRSRYRKKRVIAVIGSVAVNPWLLTSADQGGPLGELIQWSDLIAALYILGYDVTVARDPKELSEIIKHNKTDCATGKNEGMIDVIYTDIYGISLLKGYYGDNSFAKYRCMIRVLDSFGTYPEFNFPHYPYKIPKGRSGWGDVNLILTQFLTLYPHTHDNSFLGFVIPNIKRNNSTTRNRNGSRALLYAKHAFYIRNYERYLKIISEYFEIHATSVNNYALPSYIHNHGPVSGEKVQELLSESKLFIGVGFPFEGPGPLEAMANGAVFLQATFDPPISKLNNDFFGGKPTLRTLTSQNPYMEEFVGEPYCYSINITDESLLRKTLVKIKSMKRLPGKIPKEFTNEGLIERVHAFTEYMDYCNPYSPRWPPVDHLQVYVSLPGESCKDTCMARGLVCERTYFNDINKATIFERYSDNKCMEIKSLFALHAPSINTTTHVCHIQTHQQMFSCMHSENGIKRLCPCRDYEKEQTAICNNCL